ncbi:LysE family translocator [Spongiactinospora rosea]|uniref:LysE family translocator n=2 Tax=Spongiactinospora rosea TaxID=2248750 RepID=A0A366LVD3_9ACTN|nr:LysE family translocator [Spongiactinospora rosea]
MNPGLDFTIVVRQSALLGRRGGMATALGIGAGVFLWACVAATGAAALIAASAAVFMVIKMVGAAYLIWLGARALRSAIKGGGGAGVLAEIDGPAASAWVGFRRGLLTNLLNPKVIVFYVALMPQFLGDAPAVGATLLLSAIAAGVCLVWFVLVANVVGALRRLFTRRAVRRGMDAVTGTALVALGVGVAVSRT